MHEMEKVKFVPLRDVYILGVLHSTLSLHLRIAYDYQIDFPQ